MVGYLNSGDVERFLSETDRELKHSLKGSWHDCLTVNKTAGLYYQGEFESALELLDSLNFKKLPKMYRYLYVNNRLANLLGAGKIDEAGQLIDDHPKVFVASVENRQFFSAIQSNLGSYKYHRGELEVARHLIESNLAKQKFPLPRAVSHYYLGKISLDQGEIKEAEKHFQEARKLGKNTYIEDA